MNHDKQKVIKEGEAKITEILDRGINNVVLNKPELFALKDRTLKCMDERTPGGIHLAGAGILLGMDKSVEFVKKAKVDKVTWHKECGAVALYLKKKGGKPTEAEVDKEAKKFANELAEKAGIEVGEEIMQGETSFHAARAIYFDATGEFNITRELPVGFVISRAYLDKEYASEELKIVVSIAFGDHGFAELLSVERPLLIISVVKEQDIDRIDMEVEEVVMNLPEYKEGRVRLDQIIK